jgi:hypothetical protein
VLAVGLTFSAFSLPKFLVFSAPLLLMWVSAVIGARYAPVAPDKTMPGPDEQDGR